MAAKEMYDYLPNTGSADYTTTSLTVSPQTEIKEEWKMNQVVHALDDATVEVITFTTTPIFFIHLSFHTMTESDIGTILDFFADSAKGNGKERTFQYNHVDGHTYIVRFWTDLSRVARNAGTTFTKAVHGISTVVLQVEDAA